MQGQGHLPAGLLRSTLVPSSLLARGDPIKPASPPPLPELLLKGNSPPTLRLAALASAVHLPLGCSCSFVSITDFTSKPPAAAFRAPPTTTQGYFGWVCGPHNCDSQPRQLTQTPIFQASKGRPGFTSPLNTCHENVVLETIPEATKLFLGPQAGPRKDPTPP